MPFLIGGAVGIAIVPLSIHVVMLQVLGVPAPDFSSVGAWGLIVTVGQNLALIMLAALGRETLAGTSLPRRTVLLALADIVATDQVRLAVMAEVTSASAPFPAITFLAGAAPSVVVAGLVTAIVPRLRTGIARLAGAIAVTAASTLMLQPVLAAATAPFAGLQRPDIYNEPYGAGVLSISYALFAGTVAMVLAIVWIIAPRLSRRPAANFVQVAALLLLLRGTLIAQLLFPWLLEGPAQLSAIAISQFFLQDLAMVSLAWGLQFRAGHAR